MKVGTTAKIEDPLKAAGRGVFSTYLRTTSTASQARRGWWDYWNAITHKITFIRVQETTNSLGVRAPTEPRADSSDAHSIHQRSLATLHKIPNQSQTRIVPQTSPEPFTSPPFFDPTALPRKPFALPPSINPTGSSLDASWRKLLKSFLYGNSRYEKERSMQENAVKCSKIVLVKITNTSKAMLNEKKKEKTWMKKDKAKTG